MNGKGLRHIFQIQRGFESELVKNKRENEPTQIFVTQRILNIMHLNNTPLFGKIILILSPYLTFS